MFTKLNKFKLLLLLSFLVAPLWSTCASAQATTTQVTTNGVTGTDPVPPAPGPPVKLPTTDMAIALLMALGLA